MSMCSEIDETVRQAEVLITFRHCLSADGINFAEYYECEWTGCTVETKRSSCIFECEVLPSLYFGNFSHNLIVNSAVLWPRHMTLWPIIDALTECISICFMRKKQVETPEIQTKTNYQKECLWWKRLGVAENKSGSHFPLISCSGWEAKMSEWCVLG